MKASRPRPRPEEPDHPFVATVEYQGVVLDMEHRPGGVRSGVDDDGQAWRQKLKHWYGEVRGTKGADGDAVDVILRKDPDPFAPYVYVVQTKFPRRTGFDETKACLGFRSRKEALAAFRGMYNRPGFFGGVTRWPIGAWKAAMKRPTVHGGRMRLVLKKSTAEKLVGGLADSRPDSDFDPVALAAGVRVELEHTRDRAQATEIAKDHLAEDPRYYEKLRQMEKGDPVFRLFQGELRKGRRQVKSYMRRTKTGKMVQVQQYDQDRADARARPEPTPRAARRPEPEPEPRQAAAPEPSPKPSPKPAAEAPASPARADAEETGLVTSEELQLPKKAAQPKAASEDELFSHAEKAMALQAQLLNEGNGLDKALGNAKVVRGDKGVKDPHAMDHDGPVILLAPIKEKKRSREKVATKYDGDWSKLGDVVRASVSVPSFDHIPDVVNKLRAMGMVMAARPDDKFTTPTAAGYRDLSLTVRYGDHVGELQIHVHPILKVKGEAHKLYEKTRGIEAQMKLAGRRNYLLHEWQEVTRANQKMGELFGGAWNEALQGSKGSGQKLRKARAKGHTKHFDWDGDHVEWTPGYVPVRIRKDGSREPIYDMERFWRDAKPIDGPQALQKARKSVFDIPASRPKRWTAP